MKYRVWNIDRQASACFGGDPAPEFDRGVVADLTRLETVCGITRPTPVFYGSVTECHDWVQSQASPTAA